MKRMVSLLVAAMIFCAMAVPASAESEFVPSISYKDHPTVIEPIQLVDEGGAIVDYLDMGCLVITPVSEAIDAKEEERTAEEQLLVEVYEQLVDGSMKIPFEEDADDMVIRDLFDATLICGDEHTDPHHVEELAKPGVYIKLTFDLGVRDTTDVVVMTYVGGQWTPAVKVVNNGDGTVTCLFEDICPIAFCVKAGSDTPPPQTGDVYLPRLIFWAVMLVASAAAVVFLLIPRRKSKR